MPEAKESFTPSEKDITFSLEIGRTGDPVSLRPTSMPIYSESGKRPVATDYNVVLTPELYPFRQNPFLQSFLKAPLKYSFLHFYVWSREADKILQEGNDSDARFIRRGRRESYNLPYDCELISRILSPYFGSLTPQLRQQLENTTFDFNGAWENLPPINDKSFPKLWMSRFFQTQEKNWIPKEHLPVIGLKFFENPLDRKDSRDTIMAKLDEINETFESTKVLNLWIGKFSEGIPPYPSKRLSLSELADRGWPSATYAVDQSGKTWYAPIIVSDSEDRIDPFYKNLLNDYQEYKEEQKDNPRRILCTPRIDESGLPVISTEVVAGPPVSEKGFMAIVPTRVPDARFKKILAHVIDHWVSLKALDQYTITEDQRSFLAFDYVEEYVQSTDDRKLWQEFCGWLKESGLTIDFVNPVLLRQQIIEQKGRTSQLN